MPLDDAVLLTRLARKQAPVRFDLADIASAGSEGVVEDVPRNQRLMCEIALLHSRHCFGNETAAQCVFRVGAARLEQVLPIRCSNSSYFKLLLLSSAAAPASSSSSSSAAPLPLLSGGAIPDSQRRPPPPPGSSGAEYMPPYIPPQNRTYAHIFHKRRYSRVATAAGCAFVYRYTMSVPEEHIVASVPRGKVLEFFPLPLRFRAGFPVYSLGVHDEAVNFELSSRSFFAWTHRRGGWTSQRTVDLLAAGTVPLFINLDGCPGALSHCFPGLPTDLMREALYMRGVTHMWLPPKWHDVIGTPAERRNLPSAPDLFDPAFHHVGSPVINVKRLGAIDWRVFNVSQYWRIADELLRFTRRHLSTKAMAAYVLKVLGFEDVPPSSGMYVYCVAAYFSWDGLGVCHGIAALGFRVVSNSAHNTRKLHHAAPERDLAAERQRQFWKSFRGAGWTYGLRSHNANMLWCVDTPGAPSGSTNCSDLIARNKIALFLYNINADSGLSADDPHHAPYYETHVWPLVQQGRLRANQVAFFDGHDQAALFERGRVSHKACERGHPLFAREAPSPVDEDTEDVPVWPNG